MKYILIIMSLLLISFVSAQLIVSPNPIEIPVTVGEEKSFQFNLTNNFGFNIFDFTFGNLSTYGFTFPEINLSSNETKSFDFTVLTSKSNHLSIETPVQFKFNVDLPDEPTTHNIEITAQGFSPRFIIIKEGDTIKWLNKDDISHQVFSSFSYTIEPNSTAEHLFDTISTVEYNDPDWKEFVGFTGTIQVVSQSQGEQAHNPEYNIIWNVNLNSNLNPTSLVIENSGNNYSIEHGKFKRGILTITNNGNELAELIELSSKTDWIKFNRNNFNIEVGNQEFVEYTITPILIETNQTDKLYNFDIKIKASNSENKTESISVFVPFKEIASGLGETDIDFLNYLENVYCPRHQCSQLCNPELPICLEGGSSNQPNLNETEFPINVTAVSFYELKRDVARLTDSGTRTNNELKLLADKWGLTIPEIMNLVNQSLSNQEDNSSKIDGMWNMIWVIALGVVIIGAVFYVMKQLNKESYKKYLTEGAYQYRK